MYGVEVAVYSCTAHVQMDSGGFELDKGDRGDAAVLSVPVSLLCRLELAGDTCRVAPGKLKSAASHLWSLAL